MEYGITPHQVREEQKRIANGERARAADRPIRSMPATDAYREGWERIFGKKVKNGDQ